MIRALALCLLAAPSYASTCAPLADVLAGLQSRYGEAVRADALMTSGQLLVLTASEAGGWMALVVSPDMTACIIALDLGTSTGWAIRGHDGLITSGMNSLRAQMMKAVDGGLFERIEAGKFRITEFGLETIGASQKENGPPKGDPEAEEVDASSKLSKQERTRDLLG